MKEKKKGNYGIKKRVDLVFMPLRIEFGRAASGIKILCKL